jgi:hypothetical protein
MTFKECCSTFDCSLVDANVCDGWCKTGVVIERWTRDSVRSVGNVYVVSGANLEGQKQSVVKMLNV